MHADRTSAVRRGTDSEPKRPPAAHAQHGAVTMKRVPCHLDGTGPAPYLPEMQTAHFSQTVRLARPVRDKHSGPVLMDLSVRARWS